MKSVVLSILLALSIAYLTAEPGNAISCGEVDISLSSCVGYLTGQQPKPTDQCCGGVKRLKDMAVTTADKRSTCECVKTAAEHFQNIKDGNVNALPGLCGTPLPFPISRNFDCIKLY